MGKEINLMKDYPRANRDISKRGNEKTEEDRRIAREFGKEFFDGDRKNGYGGFSYNSKYWEPVIPTFQKYFNLSSKNSILDVGCAKGFMLYDFSKLIAGIKLKGIDISQYAIENCIEDMRDNLDVADARDLPFKDNSFDPFGPVRINLPPSSLIFVSLGIIIGFFPSLDIIKLKNSTNNFSSNFFISSFIVSHYSF